MAELSIRLVRDPATGAMQLRIGLVGDEDDTPAEHERRHRQLVSRLLPGLCLGGDGPAREPVVGWSPAGCGPGLGSSDDEVIVDDDENR
jgi:hypothetical protein